MQKYTFKRWPERRFLGLIEPEYIEAGDRKILCSGLWGVARHFNYLGEGFLSLSIALVFGHFTNPVGLDLLRLHCHVVHHTSGSGRPALRREIRHRKVGGVSGTGEVPDYSWNLLKQLSVEGGET